MDESALKELIASLGDQLSSIGWWMYFWTALVIAGCAGELFFVIHAYLEERKAWFKAKTRGAIAFPEKPSLWGLILEVTSVALVVVGIAGELFVDWKSDDLQTRLRSANGSLVLKLEKSAGEAKDSAKAAATDATTAKGASADAVAESGTALNLAAGARKEADSLTREITAAKQQSADASAKAADAVSRLADAEQRLADSTQKEVAAEQALRDIKSPRSLVNTNALIANLKPFKGTKYALNVFQDQESIEFTKALDSVLQAAGWVRNQPAGMRIGITTIKVFGNGPTDGAEVCVETGVRVHVVSAKPLSELQATPPQQLPIDIQAGAALRTMLPASLLPQDAHNVGEAVEIEPPPAYGSDLTICVGRKP